MALSGLKGKVFWTTNKNTVQNTKNATLVIYGMDGGRKVRITLDAKFDDGIIKQFRPEESCYDDNEEFYGVGAFSTNKIEKFITGLKIEDLNF